VPLGGVADELLHQQGHVVPPLAERRQVDVQDVQAEVEIAAKLSDRHELPQVLVGRRDDAHIDA
jgi:hypothetical protein